MFPERNYTELLRFEPVWRFVLNFKSKSNSLVRFFNGLGIKTEIRRDYLGNINVTTDTMKNSDARRWLISVSQNLKQISPIFDDKHLFEIKLLINDIQINPLLLLLRLDETPIYKIWNTKSILGSFPKDLSLFYDNAPNQIYQTAEYISKIGSDYAIDFSDSGYINFKWIRGDWTLFIKKILDILTEIQWVIGDIINNKEYTPSETILLKNKKENKRIYTYDTWKETQKKNPNLRLWFDLINDDNYISQLWNIYRPQVETILNSVKYKGELWLNYDGLIGIWQIKDSELLSANLYGVEFIYTNIYGGKLENCDFYTCKVKDSVLKLCSFYAKSKAETSDLTDCLINSESTAERCDFRGEYTVLNGKITNSNIWNGRKGPLVELEGCRVLKIGELKSGFLVAGDKVLIKNKNKL